MNKMYNRLFALNTYIENNALHLMSSTIMLRLWVIAECFYIVLWLICIAFISHVFVPINKFWFGKMVIYYQKTYKTTIIIVNTNLW